LDWVSVGRGMGVPSRRVTSLEDFATALKEGFRADGPSLVEIPL
jgi:acetolactate synthase I/II/III large subunit